MVGEAEPGEYVGGCASFTLCLYLYYGVKVLSVGSTLVLRGQCVNVAAFRRYASSSSRADLSFEDPSMSMSCSCRPGIRPTSRAAIATRER